MEDRFIAGTVLQTSRALSKFHVEWLIEILEQKKFWTLETALDTILQYDVNLYGISVEIL